MLTAVFPILIPRLLVSFGHVLKASDSGNENAVLPCLQFGLRMIISLLYLARFLYPDSEYALKLPLT